MGGWSRLIHPEDIAGAAEYAGKLLNGEHATFTVRIITKDGSIKWIQDFGKPWIDEGSGKVIGTYGAAREITQQKAIEDALQNSEQRFRYILEHDPNAIAVYDRDLHYIIASDRYIKDYGIEGKEIIGRHHYEVFPEMPQRWKDIHQQVLKGEVLRNDNDSFVRKDGSTSYNRWECRPWYTARGDIGGMITYTEVTTERVIAEKQKGLAMQELNHRVKNNLMLVASLIRLKESALGPKSDLSDLIHQVDAIRIVHEKLNRSNDIARIDMRDYLPDLLNTIFSLAPRKVEIDVSLEEINMLSRTAVAIGLIVNEVATNAIKYGIKDSREARFSMRLKFEDTPTNYLLILSNTGKPFPEDIDIAEPKTLGLQLITSLTRQLEGSISLRRSPHPEFTFRFPADDKG